LVLRCHGFPPSFGGVGNDLRQRLGALGERLAIEHLERLGFTLVERNYRTRWGELDVVVADDDTLVFCEVKTRRGAQAFPLEAVRRDKTVRVRRMAREWLRERQERPHRAVLRFDVIGVSIDARGRLIALDHREGVF
jgi:putative endonuclease